MRILPLVGGLLLSRGGRRVAGRNAGKLALALGAWELWRTYQRNRTPTGAPVATKAGTGPVRHNRRRRHPL
ncbi:cysteine protease [Brevundimonas sp.]|uniref:cysteine protease n=1 Tax=Brevundimonas sp. TaxID=1871086 RepID=UPI002FC7AE9F